jgi:hypothetical protein
MRQDEDTMRMIVLYSFPKGANRVRSKLRKGLYGVQALAEVAVDEHQTVPVPSGQEGVRIADLPEHPPAGRTGTKRTACSI